MCKPSWYGMYKGMSAAFLTLTSVSLNQDWNIRKLDRLFMHWLCVSFLGLPSQSTINRVAWTTETACLKVLETRSLRSRWWQGHAPSKRSRQDSVPGFSPSCLWFLGSWQHNVSFHMGFSLCACLCVQISSFYKGTNHTGSGPDLLYYELVLTNYSVSVMSLFPHKVAFCGGGVKT